MTAQQIVQKLWNYCDTLRDDGLSYGQYIEQLTYLLFLKMADERARTYGRDDVVPTEFAWPTLLNRDGAELESHFNHLLDHLGHKPGMLGLIFRKAQNHVKNPALLKRLIVDLMNREQWLSMGADVKGTAYEGLLEKNAQDTKGGAGQYFTPRPLIQAIVECVNPRPVQHIIDPACGTGGFLLEAHRWIADPARYTLDPMQGDHLKKHALRGVDITDMVVRLCAMNMLLNGIGSVDPDDPLPVRRGDSLAQPPGDQHFELVLTNPPFGRKSSVQVIGEDGSASREDLMIERPDFWASTSNKQLAFVQHCHSLLTIGGTCAMVVPDNVLFEGGAGETVRRKLLHECDVHTLLRLPTGLFYSQGVKANVIFFERKAGRKEPWTTDLWIYDLRTNKHFTLKQNPLQRKDLEEFVECYMPGKARGKRQELWSEENKEGRWRRYSYSELVARDKCNLDVFWLRDHSLDDGEDLPEPAVLAEEIAEDLRSALEQIELIASSLSKKEKVEE